MKYCTFCGEQIADEAVLCPHCGRMINVQPFEAQQKPLINALCIAGFICSFFVCIVGLILSIIGYNQVKNTGDLTGKNFAIAGIIISSISIGLAVIVIAFWFFALIFSVALTL